MASTMRLTDIAEHAGVSEAAVSRVLNGKAGGAVWGANTASWPLTCDAAASPLRRQGSPTSNARGSSQAKRLPSADSVLTELIGLPDRASGNPGLCSLVNSGAASRDHKLCLASLPDPVPVSASACSRQLRPGGLPEIRPRRIAAFSAARNVARIRVKVAADTGCPAHGAGG